MRSAQSLYRKTLEGGRLRKLFAIVMCDFPFLFLLVLLLPPFLLANVVCVWPYQYSYTPWPILKTCMCCKEYMTLWNAFHNMISKEYWRMLLAALSQRYHAKRPPHLHLRAQLWSLVASIPGRASSGGISMTLLTR